MVETSLSTEYYHRVSAITKIKVTYFGGTETIKLTLRLLGDILH